MNQWMECWSVMYFGSSVELNWAPRLRKTNPTTTKEAYQGSLEVGVFNLRPTLTTEASFTRRALSSFLVIIISWEASVVFKSPSFHRVAPWPPSPPSKGSQPSPSQKRCWEKSTLRTLPLLLLTFATMVLFRPDPLFNLVYIWTLY